MRDEEEVRRLRDDLLQLTGYISEYGTRENHAKESLVFSNDACDVLTWILEEIPTEGFESDGYLNLPELRRLAERIEASTGKRLEDYE